MPGPLQCGLQECSEEGPPGSGGPQNGGEGPEWVRKGTLCVARLVVILIRDGFPLFCFTPTVGEDSPLKAKEIWIGSLVRWVV